MSEILAVGEVVEPGYVWREDRAGYKHTVAVEWDTTHAKRIAKQPYWGTITVGLVAPDLYQIITGEGSMTEDKAAMLRAAFVSFRQDSFDRMRVKARRRRAGQLREMLSRPDEVDSDTFNREFWRGESKTLLRGEDITGVFLDDFNLPPERVAELSAALDAGEVELHGNYVWRPGSHVYSPKEQEGVSREDNIRRALRPLNDEVLTPLEKARAIQQIHSFGVGTATGAVMMFHPDEFAVYNEQSKEALRKLGYEAGKLEAFERSAQELKELLGADDFLELDLFLYQVNQGKYLAPMPPASVGWRDAIVRVLREAGGPLSTREVTERVVASGIATGGLTPKRTVSHELTTNPELFERVSKGIYRLRPEPNGDGGGNVWLFQARPEHYNLRAELSKKRAGDVSSWSVTANASEMRTADIAVLWQSGKDAGIYALGELTGEPYEKTYEDGTEPPWARTKGDGQPAAESRVNFRYTTILSEPIRKADIKQDPVLAGMQVIRSPQGTNFRVTPEEWEALQKLIAPSSPPAEAYAEPPFDEIREAVRGLGLLINDSTLRRYHLSLKTRKFVILSGLSGTGKTWLAEAYARAVGARYLIEPVAPNWTTNEDLLGYHNPFDLRYHHTAFSLFLKECATEYERARERGFTARPYHLILDEMNLARVEHYFAKFLSAMEVRQRQGQAVIWLGPAESVNLTPNLHFVGTVNVDETTHGFAQKVYDRAQLIELQASPDDLRRHLGKAPFTEEIMDIWKEVNLVAPFAFRVLDDIKAYVEEAERMGISWQVALDEQVLQKVLPKCGGADLRVERALKFLSELPVEAYPLTSRKAKEMLDEYGQSGFASFF
ncbi:MAG: EVE domain-containing protein [Pyrinomonadaceae bacterium]